MPLLEFSEIGKRRRPDSGIYYPSTCGEYAIYHSDQIYGVPVNQEIWLAVWYGIQRDGTRDTIGRVIGRKRGRGTAEGACRKHCRERSREAKASALLGPVKTKRRTKTVKQKQEQLF